MLLSNWVSGGNVYSQIELDSTASSGPSIMERMTFSYGLGEKHGLFENMRAAQAELAVEE